MARKRETPKARLRQEFERARGPHLRDLLPKTDYSDKRAREIGANIALTLTSHAVDAPLRTAFKEFGLDPLDPWNWRILLDHLVKVTLPAGSQHAPRGARPKWDEDRRSLWDSHVAWARKQVKKVSHGKSDGQPMRILPAISFLGCPPFMEPFNSKHFENISFPDPRKEALRNNSALISAI
jgi:hypothetical protein